MVDEHFIRNYNLYATKLLHGVNVYIQYCFPKDLKILVNMIGKTVVGMNC